MNSELQITPSSQRQRASTLRITEIFFSIQGESVKAGIPTVFIRLTGCPLRCHYCDTAYAFHGGRKMSISSILNTAAQYRTKHVTVTGGEPLTQSACPQLLKQLCDKGFRVSLETSGTLDITDVDTRVMKIMDIKTPASNECAKNRFENLAHLDRQDQIKFVICNREDYEWSVGKIAKFKLDDICEVLFSPEHQSLNPTDLADWIVADGLNVRLQIQLHKYLWGNHPGK